MPSGYEAWCFAKRTASVSRTARCPPKPWILYRKRKFSTVSCHRGMKFDFFVKQLVGDGAHDVPFDRSKIKSQAFRAVEGASPYRLMPKFIQPHLKNIKFSTPSSTRSDLISNQYPPKKEFPTALRPKQTVTSAFILDGARWESS